jgi:hypothetical protein
MANSNKGKMQPVTKVNPNVARIADLSWSASFVQESGGKTHPVKPSAGSFELLIAQYP